VSALCEINVFNIIAGGLLTYDFLLSRLRGFSSTTMQATPLLVPCVGVMAMGHGSCIVMGQLCDESHGSWVTKDDQFPSLIHIPISGQ